MVNQPTRHAIIKMPKQKPEFIKTPFIKDVMTKEEWNQEFKQRTFRLTDFVKPRIEAENIINQRCLEIEHGAHRSLKEPKSFKE